MIRLIIFILFLQFTITGCNINKTNQHAQTAPDNGELQFRMNKLVQYQNNQNQKITYIYEYDESGNLVLELIADSSAMGIRSSKKVHTYEDTLHLQTIMLTEFGDTSYIIDLEYNEDNLPVEKRSRSEEQEIVIRYYYDDRGNIIEQIQEEPGAISRLTFTYTPDDQLHEAYQFIQDQMQRKNIYMYNDKDQLETLLFLDATGDTTNHWFYEYDERGNRIYEKEIDQDGRIFIRKTMTYDENNRKLLEEGHRPRQYRVSSVWNGNMHKMDKHYNQYDQLERIIYYEPY